jgi:hypothetical protein
MENVHMMEGKFIDGKTIRLLEEYPFAMKEVRLIIIPETKVKGKRKAGLLKGKIRMAEDFNSPLEDMKEYME